MTPAPIASNICQKKICFRWKSQPKAAGKCLTEIPQRRVNELWGNCTWVQRRCPGCTCDEWPERITSKIIVGRGPKNSKNENTEPNYRPNPFSPQPKKMSCPVFKMIGWMDYSIGFILAKYLRVKKEESKYFELQYFFCTSQSRI